MVKLNMTLINLLLYIMFNFVHFVSNDPNTIVGEQIRERTVSWKVYTLFCVLAIINGLKTKNNKNDLNLRFGPGE